MNETQENTKNRVIKTLAILGLISIIIIGIWLSVQVVRVIPGAFSSLASIANSVQNNRPLSTLTIATEKSIVNAGESFNISWTNLDKEGTYSFYYTCTDGTSVEIRTANGRISAMQCDNNITLPEGDYSLDITVSSERKRFIDIPFTISFNEPNQEEPLFQKNGKVTIINATIPQSVDAAIRDTLEEQPQNEIEYEGIVKQEEEEKTAIRNTTEPNTIPANSEVATPVETVLSYIPQSRPNGFIDLEITYLGIGTLDNNNFNPSGSIDKDSRGAIRFEVKNIGTKTSGNWAFKLILPSGFAFKSDEQNGLKPNEKAVYTLGFDNSSEAGNQPIFAELNVENDNNNTNNSFRWTVKITN